MQSFGKLTFYQVLNVKQTANEREIKQAYKRSVLKYHPDRFKKKKDKAREEKFLEVQEAWETLRDPALRSAYDQDIASQKQVKFEFTKKKAPEMDKKGTEWAASARSAYSRDDGIDLNVDDELKVGEEVHAIWGTMGHWFGGTVDEECPDGRYKVAIQAAGQIHLSTLSRDNIRRAGESVEDAEAALDRHDKRREEYKCLAQWQDGKWYMGYLCGMNEDGTYQVFWNHTRRNISERIPRHKIKFKRQLDAEERAPTYTKFFQTGQVDLFPTWDFIKNEDGSMSTMQRDIIKGEKLFQKLKQETRKKGVDDSTIQRKGYFDIEEEMWDFSKIRQALGIEEEKPKEEHKDNALKPRKREVYQQFDTANPRSWTTDELSSWIRATFKKPTLVKKLSTYATQVNANAFFTTMQKPEELKKIGIKMKSMHKKVAASIQGLNLRVW